MTQPVSAQQTRRTFTGSVTTTKGEPVVGASVIVRGQTTGTTTDAQGAFQISANEGQTLEISGVGYTPMQVVLSGNNAVAITLQQRVGGMEEVVVVGYGTQRRRDLTGSVATINVAESKKYVTSDMSQLLQGRAAGVAVTSDGQPGAAPVVRIRGVSTFGSQSPFYVVDGVPVGNSVRDFSPNDIESIQVLKDAAAAAIYGAEAANGVIIITTRQGRKNQPVRVEYNGSYGVDKVWQNVPVTNRVQYQTLLNEALANAGRPLFPANNPTDAGYIGNIDTDWRKAGLKNGTRQNHNINLSGGGISNTYNVSLDYFDQNGTYVGQGPSYERYTARVNNTLEKGIFKLGSSVAYTRSHENSLTFRDDILLGGIPPLINSLVMAIPTMRVYDPANQGGFGGSNAEYHGENSLNGVGVNSMFRNFVDVDRVFANVYGELHLLRGDNQNLRYRVNLGYDKTITRDYSFVPEFFMGKFFSNTIAQLNDNSRNFTFLTLENTLNYDKNFGRHNVSALAGYSYRENNGLFRESNARGFSQPYFPVINSGQNRSSRGFEFTNTLVSYFGRINYNFADRYLFSATLRRDGSSRFSPAVRYGNFPAASVGWKISSEDFWKVSPKLISQLKLRASYGRLGNQNIADYAFQGTINPGVVYTFGDVRSTGAIQTSVVSERLQWEGKATTNFGFDATLFNNRLDITAEYYNAKSTDLLLGIPIPASVGSINQAPVVNAASMVNKGLEILVAYHKTRGAFTYDISANFSTVNNEVLSLGNGNAYLQGAGARTIVGEQIGRHYGLVYEGIFQNQTEINNSATQFGVALKPGDVRYKDISGPNGKPDGKVDLDYDRTYLGSGLPKYHYGINLTAGYKGFDVSVFASGSASYLVNSRLYRDLMHSGGGNNYSEEMLNRWTPTNTNTNVPRLNYLDANNFYDSDRPGWLQDGSYLRINTVSVGYQLPGSLVKGLSRARVYLTAQNLYTFQKYKGFNPDFTSGTLNPGFDFGSYPRPRTIMGGVQVSF
jgi:TonB-linked SusC/RagA family outer membrane protein